MGSRRSCDTWHGGSDGGRSSSESNTSGSGGVGMVRPGRLDVDLQGLSEPPPVLTRAAAKALLEIIVRAYRRRAEPGCIAP